MITQRDAQLAKDFKQRVQEVTPVAQVILFGSRARGDAEPKSDYDFFIEVPDLTASLRKRIYEIAWEVGYTFGTVVTTLLATSSSMREEPFVSNPIRLAIEEEGVAI